MRVAARSRRSQQRICERSRLLRVNRERDSILRDRRLELGQHLGQIGDRLLNLGRPPQEGDDVLRQPYERLGGFSIPARGHELERRFIRVLDAGGRPDQSVREIGDRPAADFGGKSRHHLLEDAPAVGRRKNEKSQRQSILTEGPKRRRKLRPQRPPAPAEFAPSASGVPETIALWIGAGSA